MPLSSCKICSDTTSAIRAYRPPGLYYSCSKCRFISADYSFVPDPDEEKSRYLMHNNSPENSGYTSMLSEFIKHSIEPYIKTPGDILDFGCGPDPVLANMLMKKGFDVDIYDRYFAQKKLFQKKKYDLICLTEVIEHLISPKKTLLMLKDCLSEKGCLSIMTRFFNGDISGFSDWWYRKDRTHISFFSPVTVEILSQELYMKLILTDPGRSCVLRLS
ncbi:MAG: class I SAM-dependent methyltransferase [Elusimicrobiota bacterium]